ncbi:hypothetical protein SteCoe_30099 [Stentor coeruleus]|uniref:Uncharacterized protein n=1 Tax=Stentor coeruleus TaxID=5963 RepID=A0A1R2B4A7_9CILI|nr:hypothetical protein SteCoe_30099 [Stentor coeruleus]
MIKRDFTIQQVLQQTGTMEKALVEKLQTLSHKALGLYKRFINRCNSLFIIFSQFDILSASFSLLHKALTIDLKTFFDPNIMEKAWKGRVLLYINIGYLMTNIGDSASSMKFLYDAESLIMESKNSNTNIMKDLLLSHSIIAAFSAFKARRFESVEKYIEIASLEFNTIIRGERLSKVTKNGCCNLYCLVTLMLEVLKSQNTGLASTTNSRFATKKMRKYGVSALDLLDNYNENPTVENGIALVNSSEFKNILSATVLFPFIVKSTPVIQLCDLKQAQEQSQNFKLTKMFLAQSLGKSYKSVERRDFYSILMTESIQNAYNIN